MGWKLALVVVQDSADADPAGEPDGVLRALGYDRTIHVGSGDLASDCNPGDGEVSVGRYDRGWVIADRDLVTGVLRNPVKDMERRPLLSAFPSHHILVAYLHSFDNSYGHATFVNGELVRAKCGAHDKPVRLEEGSPHPIEESYFAKSILKRRRRYYRLDDGEYDLDDSDIGEDIVLRLVNEQLGPGGMEAGVFPMNRFRKVARFLIWKRAADAKTAMISEVHGALDRGETVAAMGPFDLAAVRASVDGVLAPNTDSDVRVTDGSGEHGHWISLECPFDKREEIQDALLSVSVDNDLLLYVAHDKSVFNNRRSY